MRCDHPFRVWQSAPTTIFSDSMKKYLLTGFITLLPITLTIIIIVWLFDFFTTPFVGIMEKLLLSEGGSSTLLKNPTFVVFLSRVLVLIFLFVLTLRSEEHTSEL